MPDFRCMSYDNLPQSFDVQHQCFPLQQMLHDDNSLTDCAAKNDFLTLESSNIVVFDGVSSANAETKRSMHSC